MSLFSRSLAAALLTAYALSLFPGTRPVEEPASIVSTVDYSDEMSWAYCETDLTDRRADVFFVATTASTGRDGLMNIDLSDESRLAKVLGTINMERGIYDADARVFAPYYRSAALPALSEPGGAENEYFDLAYSDVREAFVYYLEHYNNGRPILLAGFSQGGIMCVRLMKEFFGDEALRDRLIACYAVGWHLTEEDTREYPQLVPAQAEDDTGVIVSFDCEAEYITESAVIPADMKTLSINPLNWRTDSTPADRELNLGACFTDYSGAITEEIPALTGGYLDPQRGTFKLTDVSADEYPGVQFEDGIFHVYDYQFFYRNLQENVAVRMEAFFNRES